MGLLTVGEPLSWQETKNYAEHVRQHGLQQFINIYNLLKTKTNCLLKFGDEIEYIVIKFDHENRTVRVSNRAVELLKELQKPEDEGMECASLWRPEFGSYMVEGTPGVPYSMDPSPLKQLLDGENNEEKNFNIKVVNEDATFMFLNVVEANMKLRRKQVQDLLKEDEAVLSISPFPTLGTFDFCSPQSFVHPTYGYGRSLFFPDECIFSGHPRFCTLVNNIRERRGSNVEIYLPIFKDSHTPSPFQENFIEAMNIDPKEISGEEYNSYCEAAKTRQDLVRQDDQVYMDAMGFGMGCCCLQVTFQASNIKEACTLYDQLAPLCPILMALSAASPVFRGYLVDVDCRWSVISQSVDDRTVAERTGRDPETGEPCRFIPKSRFDSIDMFIGEENSFYNDIEVVYDKDYYQKLIENDVPPLLAKHIAHLFIRDPLVLFKEKLNIDDTKESDHFENIQSTNWQTMRFKPPPLGSPEIGWRVEFRPMEVQLTDTENAAYIIFIVLITRLILSFNLNLLIPMSKVEENMKEAKKRDASRNSRFWFRRDVYFPQCVCDHFVHSKPECLKIQKMSRCLSPSNKPNYDQSNIDSCCVLLTMNEIINGSDDDFTEGKFPGLIPLLNFYLDSIEIDANIRCTLNSYLKIISLRAQGELPTAAQLIRKFVTTHDEYKNDSKITNGIAYDLLYQLNLLQTDQLTLEQLIDLIEKKRRK